MRSILPLASLVFAISLLAFAAWLAPSVTSGGGQISIYVNTTDATEVNDSLCSLPEAIKAANTNTDYFGCAGSGGSTDDLILFVLTGPVPRIDVTTELPPITEGLFLSGINTPTGVEMVELRGPGGAQVSGDHGLTITAPNVTVVSLVINSFRDAGVVVEGDNFLLVYSRIGTNAEGTAALPNASVGVQVKAHNARIGSENCEGICNLISGNGGEGILVDPTATGTSIQGNYIGTNLAGDAALVPNSQQPGIWVKGSQTTIGGDTNDPNGCTAPCNLISGNRFGIRLTSTASSNSIDGNVIGLDAAGENSLQSTLGGNGINDDAEHTIIGQVEGNTISGFNVGMYASGTNTFFHRNRVGTDTEGLAAVPNISGIWAGGANTFLITDDNVISGNLSSGVYVSDGSTGVRVEGNRIGVSADGSPLPNGVGVEIFASAMNIVSNPANPNEIAYNLNDGILVFGPAATGNLITGNSIHDNGGLGISNEAGGNAELPPPVIENADANGANGTVCPNCVIEIFSDNGDEGRTYEGFTTPTAAGVWTYVGALDGPNITAVAWDVTVFNTSEFSTPFVIFVPTPSPSPSPSSSPSPTPFALIQGDVNCDGVVDEDDFLLLLSYTAGLDDGVQPPPCINLGGSLGITLWGDVNCDGAVNALDALFVLAHIAGAPWPTPTNCAAIGLGFN